MSSISIFSPLGLLLLALIIGAFFVIRRFKKPVNYVFISAICILVCSAAAIICGAVYRSNHPFEGAAGVFGYDNDNYVLAGWALGVGVLAFLIGIGLLIPGLIRQTKVQVNLLNPNGTFATGNSVETGPIQIDSAKWNALVQYDKDVSAAVAKVQPYGAKWVNELAVAFLAINDKSYLPAIVEQIIRRASDEGNLRHS